MLQLHLFLVPPRAERPSEAPHVSHPEPGQEGRAGEMLVQILLAEAQPAPDSPPDLLLAVEGERQVDPVERHPVDVFLPVWPLPPHRAVAGSADVLVVPIVENISQSKNISNTTDLYWSWDTRLVLTGGRGEGRESWEVSHEM